MTSTFEFDFSARGLSGDISGEGDSQCRRLIDIADTRRWSPARDLAWPLLTASKPSIDHPAADSAHMLAGFAPYESLEPDGKALIHQCRHQMEISEILHGEMLAMMVASQLVCMLQDPEAKKFAAIQAADEARHVSFFRQYLSALGLPVLEPSASLQRFMLKTLQNRRWEQKILSCQIVIESLAMAQLSWLKKSAQSLLLRDGLSRILEDEARHVQFGVTLLDRHFRQLHSAAQERHASYVIDSVMSLSPADNHLTLLAEDNGWDSHALRHHLRMKRIAEPELYQARFRQLAINLRRVGLLTPGAAARLKRFIGGAELC